MLSLAFRTFEFLVYHLLIVVVDRVSRLPRGSNPPEIMRLYRENLALKAQNGALLLELNAARGKRPKMPRILDTFDALGSPQPHSRRSGSMDRKPSRRDSCSCHHPR